MPGFSCLPCSAVLGVWLPRPRLPLCSQREGGDVTGGLGGRREARPLRPSLGGRAMAFLEPPPSAHLLRVHGQEPATPGCKGVGDLRHFKQDLFLFLY